MNNVFVPSLRKVIIVVAVMISLLSLIIGFSTGSLNIELLMLGLLIGFVFSLFVFFYGLGQKLIVKDGEIRLYSNFFHIFSNKPEQVLLISELKSIRFGQPKLNEKATFRAINIATTDKEITFNTDLFEKSEICRLFCYLKKLNSSITMDQYSEAIIQC